MSLGAARPLGAIRHGELVLITSGTAPHDKLASLRGARQRTIERHNVDVHYGVSVPSPGFAGVPQAYREAALSLSYDADLNVAGAARRIQVHPNTVRYRLGQIATKTGHDPRTFAGLVELLCILEITQTRRR
jgi:hypothetical protein